MPSRVFVLSESAYQRGSDYDVVMLYQVLLGRNPENSQVIQDHRTHSLNVALQTFISSTEFREAVLEPIHSGGTVRRHDIVPKPSTEHLNWLFSRTVLDDALKLQLRQASSWDQFFQTLCSLDGFVEQLPPPAPRPARPPAAFRPPTRAAAPPAPAEPFTAAITGTEHAALTARLDRLEAMLETLLARGTAQPTPSNPPAAATGSGLGLAASEAMKAVGKAKPSSKRQAR